MKKALLLSEKLNIRTSKEIGIKNNFVRLDPIIRSTETRFSAAKPRIHHYFQAYHRFNRINRKLKMLQIKTRNCINRKL